MHIGGARTALFNYLIARKEGGQFVIRFEDTDQTRHVETGVDSQLNGLKWLGIEWDESVDVGGPYGPYRQTERLDLYRPFIDRLLQEGNATTVTVRKRSWRRSGLSRRLRARCRCIRANAAI